MGIEDNLSSGEKVVRKFHPSALNYWGWYAIGLVLILLILTSPIGLAVILYIELKRRGTTYLVTDRRIIKEVGIFGKASTTTIYSKITDIGMRQSAIQRIFGIGNIYIDTAGGDDMEIVIRGVGGVKRVKGEIEAAWSGAKGN
ncbi:Bacterial PH domain protein [uncultured archaeon]|nr:Bacterial PH domain protein [uncultured archaeon]